ncbi:unnamed protein product [Ranitomeya imitator]|uniref:Uncharacterized protein n=1 Tax=Ranitomeya imitator TaxID=111125 RepID=A0ABN9LUJ3_9NEOB|nr:unnamed protein product [Ranitomeya imitator]
MNQGRRAGKTEGRQEENEPEKMDQTGAEKDLNQTGPNEGACVEQVQDGREEERAPHAEIPEQQEEDAGNRCDTERRGEMERAGLIGEAAAASEEAVSTTEQQR